MHHDLQFRKPVENTTVQITTENRLGNQAMTVMTKSFSTNCIISLPLV